MAAGWPSVPGFEESASTLLTQAHALALRILTLLEPLACPHLAPGTLAKAHTTWGPDGQCTLRLLHYPPIEKPEDMPPGYWRAGPHTDWCCVTLLFQRNGEAGLECAPNPKAGGADGSGGWLKVDPVEGGICVNIGDMLMRWSNKSLLSNLHRVRMPTKEEASPPRSRYSIAFFAQADKSAVIKCEGHDDISAGDYILGRIQSNFKK
jgi:isopenicillin N synthase-like dioxygenase